MLAGVNGLINDEILGVSASKHSLEIRRFCVSLLLNEDGLVKMGFCAVLIDLDGLVNVFGKIAFSFGVVGGLPFSMMQDQAVLTCTSQGLYET